MPQSYKTRLTIVRYLIYRLLTKGPATASQIEEMSEGFAEVNWIRVTLQAGVEAGEIGLAGEETQGRGRPAQLYKIKKPGREILRKNVAKIKRILG